MRTVISGSRNPQLHIARPVRLNLLCETCAAGRFAQCSLCPFKGISRIADQEQRTITQLCEMLLDEGVETYKKEVPRLITKQKLRPK